MTAFLSMTVIVALTAPAQAGQADPRAEAIAPFVGDETAAVLHLDLANLDINAFARNVLGGILTENEIDDATRDISNRLEAFRKAGAKDFYILLNPADLPRMPVAVIPLTEGADADAIGQALCGNPDQVLQWPTCATVKGAVFAGTDEALERIRRPNPKPRREIADAFAAAGESPVQIVIVPSADQRRVLEEMVPTLPPELGNAPITTLTQGVSWAVLVLNTQPKATLRAIVQSRDPATAEALRKIARDGLNLARQVLQGDKTLRELAEALNQVKPEVANDRVVLTIDLKQASALVGVPLRRARARAQRAQCVNNLKQLALAMHNYLSQHKTFPPAYSQDADGKPLLSWRVHILPFIEQQALYGEFHLDEPWDSPHNKTLIERMPATYHCPSAPSEFLRSGKTTYLAPRGDAMIFPDARGVTIKEITDGTSNTILVIDANVDHAAIWTKPDDWEVGAEIDPSILFGNHLGGTSAAFADGSVHFLRESIDPAVLRKMATRNGGEVLSADDY